MVWTLGRGGGVAVLVQFLNAGEFGTKFLWYLSFDVMYQCQFTALFPRNGIGGK